MKALTLKTAPPLKKKLEEVVGVFPAPLLPGEGVSVGQTLTEGALPGLPSVRTGTGIPGTHGWLVGEGLLYPGGWANVGAPEYLPQKSTPQGGVSLYDLLGA